MYTILLVCILGILGSAIEGTRYTRDTGECKKVTEDSESCRTRAYEDYRKELKAGDDKKKPDWMARKACNYLTASVETCLNKLVGVCHSQDEVNKIKDEQLEDSLKHVKATIPNWDSDKCPAMKAHEDRLNDAKADEKEEPNAEPEADPTGSASTLTVSVLFTIFLALFL